MNTIFIIIAERWGDNNNHSYIVGWSPDIDGAKLLATSESKYRGGKYAGVIYRVENYCESKMEVWRFPSQADNNWTEEHHKLFNKLEKEDNK